MKFHIVSLSLDRMLSWCMDPNLLSLELSSINIVNSTESTLDLHHVVFPKESHISRKHMTEDEHSLGLNFFSTECLREINGTLLATFNTGAFPVKTVRCIIPSIITSSTLCWHVNNLLNLFLGLNNDVIIFSSLVRTWLSNSSGGCTNPVLFGVSVLSTDVPLFLFFVDDSETVLWVLRWLD